MKKKSGNLHTIKFGCSDRGREIESSPMYKYTVLRISRQRLFNYFLLRKKAICTVLPAATAEVSTWGMDSCSTILY